MRKNLLLGFLLAVIAAIPSYANEWSKTYRVGTHPSLRFDTNDGGINLVSSNVPEIEARIVTEGWEIGKDVQVTETQSGNSVDIRVRVPEWNWQLFNINHRSIHIELHVPRESDLNLHTGDGSVNVEYVTGRISVDTGDGRITAQDLKGEIRLHTGDGRIEGSGFDGELNADTGDGQVLVRGRFDSLHLRTGDGSIEATAESRSTVSSDWSVHTGDGSIRLRLPRDFSAELDATTGDGRIRTDFPITTSGSQRTTSLRGKLAGGGGLLQVHTGDGSITLERL